MKCALTSRIDPQRYLKLLALVCDVHDEDVQLLVPDLQRLQFNLVAFCLLRERILLVL
jgi:hypothetical protein